MCAEQLPQLTGRQEKCIIADQPAHFAADRRKKPDALIGKPSYCGQRCCPGAAQCQLKRVLVQPESGIVTGFKKLCSIVISRVAPEWLGNQAPTVEHELQFLLGRNLPFRSPIISDQSCQLEQTCIVLVKSVGAT